MTQAGHEWVYQSATRAAKLIGRQMGMTTEEVEDVASAAYLYLVTKESEVSDKLVWIKARQLCLDTVRSYGHSNTSSVPMCELEAVADPAPDDIPHLDLPFGLSERERAIAVGLGLGLTAEELGVGKHAVCRFRRKARTMRG